MCSLRGIRQIPYFNLSFVETPHSTNFKINVVADVLKRFNEPRTLRNKFFSPDQLAKLYYVSPVVTVEKERRAQEEKEGGLESSEIGEFANFFYRQYVVIGRGYFR